MLFDCLQYYLLLYLLTMDYVSVSLFYISVSLAYFAHFVTHFISSHVV